MRWAIKPFPRPGRIGSPHRQMRLCVQARLLRKPYGLRTSMSNGRRCVSGPSSAATSDPVGPVSLQTPPEHRPTAGDRRQPAHPAGALPADVPMGAQLACQRPGPCSIDCVYGLGRFYNLGCPGRGLVGGRGPVPHGRAPRYVRSPISRTCPAYPWRRSPRRRSCSRSLTRIPRRNAEESRA
jgi:hypothetical protein